MSAGLANPAAGGVAQTRDRWWRLDLGVALVGAALLLAWDTSPLDLWLAQRIGTAQGFAWQEHWVVQGVFHDAARRIGLFVALLMTLNLRWPLWPARRMRTSERVHWWLLTATGLVLVTLLKHSNATSCPWDLSLFGGVAEHLSHWRWRTADGGPGGCFPSGHAATAFAFWSGWFVWRDTQPVLARRWLLGVLAAGLLIGAAQMLRGAHFASHVGWTAWVCWVVGAVGVRLGPPRDRLPG